VKQANRGVVLALVCAAQFMVVLDVAIVNVALPSIRRDLHIRQHTRQWIIIAYGLMLGSFLLLGGRLADLGLGLMPWGAIVMVVPRLVGERIPRFGERIFITTGRSLQPAALA
jgi:MFS family permease